MSFSDFPFLFFSFCSKIIKCLRKHSTAFFDIHAMVSHPEKWVNDFAAAGANSMTFHIEVCLVSICSLFLSHSLASSIGYF